MLAKYFSSGDIFNTKRSRFFVKAIDKINTDSDNITVDVYDVTHTNICNEQNLRKIQLSQNEPIIYIGKGQLAKYILPPVKMKDGTLIKDAFPLITANKKKNIGTVIVFETRLSELFDNNQLIELS